MAVSAYQKLDIVCNDDRHRDRVVKIEVAHRVGAGGLWFARKAVHRPGLGPEPVALPAVQAHRHHSESGVGKSALWERIGSPSSQGRRRYRCKLCGTTVEATEPVLAELLDSVAALGMSQAPLSLLALLVSKRT